MALVTYKNAWNASKIFAACMVYSLRGATRNECPFGASMVLGVNVRILVTLVFLAIMQYIASSMY